MPARASYVKSRARERAEGQAQAAHRAGMAHPRRVTYGSGASPHEPSMAQVLKTSQILRPTSPREGAPPPAKTGFWGRVLKRYWSRGARGRSVTIAGGLVMFRDEDLRARAEILIGKA